MVQTEQQYICIHQVSTHLGADADAKADADADVTADANADVGAKADVDADGGVGADGDIDFGVSVPASRAGGEGARRAARAAAARQRGL